MNSKKYILVFLLVLTLALSAVPAFAATSDTASNYYQYGYVYDDNSEVYPLATCNLLTLDEKTGVLEAVVVLGGHEYYFKSTNWDKNKGYSLIDGNYVSGTESYPGQIAINPSISTIAGNIELQQNIYNFVVAQKDSDLPVFDDMMSKMAGAPIQESQSNVMAATTTDSKIRCDITATEMRMHVIGSSTFRRDTYQNYFIRSGLTNSNYVAPYFVVTLNRNYLTPIVNNTIFFGVTDVSPKKSGSTSTWTASITFLYQALSATVQFSSTSSNSDYFAAGTSSTQASYVYNRSGGFPVSKYYWTGTLSSTAGPGGNFSLRLPGDAVVGATYKATAKADWQIYSIQYNLYTTRSASGTLSVSCVN